MRWRGSVYKIQSWEKISTTGEGIRSDRMLNVTEIPIYSKKGRVELYVHIIRHLFLSNKLYSWIWICVFYVFVSHRLQHDGDWWVY